MKKSLSIHLSVSSGIKPGTISSTCTDEIQYIVINLYKDHPSIKHIKNKVTPDSNQKEVIFYFLFFTIPPKLIKIASNFLASILITATNYSIEKSVFRDNAKVATVVSLDKGNQIKMISLSIENYFSTMVSAYRKNYSTQHIITRLVDEWREHLDENFLVGAVLTDPSKAFDCIVHDLVLATQCCVKFTRTLSNQKQCIRINNTYSSYQKIISCVPQGSILGSIFFNLSINDLFLFVSDVSLHSFANDNTLPAFAETILELIDILQSGPKIVIVSATRRR